MLRRFVPGFLRITLAVAAFLFLLWWFGMRMPGRNISNAAPLSEAELALRAELVADVGTLAGDIGDRNLLRPTQLTAAAEFIEGSFARAGLKPSRDSYELQGRA